jgi:hypothetical protein
LNIFLISLIHGASHQYMLKLTTCPLSNALIIALILGNSDVPWVMVLQLLNVLLAGKNQCFNHWCSIKLNRFSRQHEMFSVNTLVCILKRFLFSDI